MGGVVLIRHCKHSDPGARSKNEDSLGTWEIGSGSNTWVLLSVADGLGGHRVGDGSGNRTGFSLPCGRSRNGHKFFHTG